MKTITEEEELRIYRNFFHKINLHAICCDGRKVLEGVDIIRNWSYAHELFMDDEQLITSVEEQINKMRRY